MNPHSIPRTVVGALLEHGHTDLVRRLAENGDWHCADELARKRPAEAPQLLRPFAGTGWWPAAGTLELLRGHAAGGAWGPVRMLAYRLAGLGRYDEALELVRGQVPHVDQVRVLADLLARDGREEQLREFAAGAGGEHAVTRLAEMLAELGRMDEAVVLWQPALEDGSPNAAYHLAGLLARHGRAGEAIAMLMPFIRTMTGDRDWIIGRLSETMIGQGRADEALAFIDEVAAAEGGMSLELFVERSRVLGTTGRTEQAIVELRAHSEGGEPYAATILGDLLAQAGRLDEAEAVLPPGELLATVLIRQGRADEAVRMLTPW
ncbi:hypothetical protein [Actinoplanes sp. NPDC051494]|uniref:hypothetical protein n=1 Tax=Actinoplanes sp. NPDC051494 TaxID=3363907 RepID=UPI00378C6BF1